MPKYVEIKFWECRECNERVPMEVGRYDHCVTCGCRRNKYSKYYVRLVPAGDRAKPPHLRSLPAHGSDCSGPQLRGAHIDRPQHPASSFSSTTTGLGFRTGLPRGATKFQPGLPSVPPKHDGKLQGGKKPATKWECCMCGYCPLSISQDTHCCNPHCETRHRMCSRCTKW